MRKRTSKTPAVDSDDEETKPQTSRPQRTTTKRKNVEAEDAHGSDDSDIDEEPEADEASNSAKSHENADDDEPVDADSAVDEGDEKGKVRGSAKKNKKSKRNDEAASSKKKEGNNKENDTPSRSKPKSNEKRRAKRGESPAATGDQEEYEVEAIVGDRAIKGRVQYKVRWRGYESEDDTWENESSLDCNELIEEYNDSKGDDAPTRSSSAAASSKPPVPKKAKKAPKPKEVQSRHGEYTRDGPTENGEWEVYKIIEMHTLKTGKREFLVRWKGYPPEDDSWEPEEHLKGTELLKNFLKKVERARELSDKELRISRKPTDRYTAMPQGSLRRESKRFQNKQRVKYYDAD